MASIVPMKGVIRLLVVFCSLWLVAVCAVAWSQYAGVNEGIFVSVSHYPVGLQASQIRGYRAQLRKQLVDGKRDLGENMPMPGHDKNAASTAWIKQLAQKRATLVNDALSMVPQKKLPFTDDYLLGIARTTNLPQHVVTTHPRKAEKIYRLLQLESIWKHPFMEQSSTEVRFRPFSFMVIAFGVPVAIVGLCFIAYQIIAWVLAGFRSS